MLINLWPGRRLKKQALRATLLFIFGIFILRTLRDQRDAVTRESPVNFSPLHRRGEHSLHPPEKPIRHFNGTHIDDRYGLQRTLKAGGQGSVHLYQDAFSSPPTLLIVKTISAVARNELPPQLRSTFENITTTWPSEIDASLSIPAAASGQDPPFVPVHDYFILQDTTSSSSSWSWALVTPFISDGTLDDLAKQVRSVGRTNDIDRMYRGTFDRLLSDLRSLHSQGFCHDDVKPQNIFVQSRHHWLLGDLGNTREIGHAWHGTRLWKRRNQWSDCRLNDIRRALKSYLSFLRGASHDREQFDLDFLDAATDWARMYWEFMRSPASWSPQSEGGASSTNGTSAEGIAWNDGPPIWYSKMVDTSLRAVAVKQELLCTSLWWKLWLTP